MFKKLRNILFTLVLATSLVACGSKNIDETVDVVSDFDINLIFDSEYQFKINDKDQVAFVECLDKENKLLKKTNVLDLDFSAAIKQVLNDAYSANPNKATKIEFKISGLKDEFKLETLRFNLFRLADNFNNLNKINLDIVVDGKDFNNLEKDGYGNVIKLVEQVATGSKEYYFDLNSNINKVVNISNEQTETIEYKDGKTTLSTVTEANGDSLQTQYDINGDVLKTISKLKDGTVEEKFYENKIVIKETLKSKDGYSVEIKYDSEGKITNKLVSYENGNVESYTYNNEKVSLFTITYPDKSFEESTYDENGKQTSFIARYSNGSTKDMIFENGTIVKEIHNHPGKHHAEFNYKNGMKVSAKITDENNSQIEQTFYGDGSTIKSQSTLFSDGRKLVENFNDAGILLNSTETTNDQTIERTYYANGNVHSEIIKSKNGEAVENNYSEDGKLITDNSNEE